MPILFSTFRLTDIVYQLLSLFGSINAVSQMFSQQGFTIFFNNLQFLLDLFLNDGTNIGRNLQLIGEMRTIGILFNQLSNQLKSLTIMAVKIGLNGIQPIEDVLQEKLIRLRHLFERFNLHLDAAINELI